MKIPKTIQNIYVMALKRKAFFKQGKRKNKHIVYQYSCLPPRNIIEKIVLAIMLWFTEKDIVSKKHILRPITDTEICQFAWCGVNIETGRKYCDVHRWTCERCHKKDIDIICAGIGLCWDCNGSI